MKNTIIDSTENEKKDRAAMKESLLLPCTSTGKTTSASIAERSNVWAENKLLEKKTILDKKLHRSIVKLNVDRLAVVHELTKLRKSASTGALDRIDTHNYGKHDQNTNKPIIKSLSKSSLSSTGSCDKTISDHSVFSHSDVRRKRNETVLRPSDSKTNISITIGGNCSSDEQSGDDSSGSDVQESKRTLTHTSRACPLGRECSSGRSEGRKIENVTRRYTKQLSPKSVNGK